MDGAFIDAARRFGNDDPRVDAARRWNSSSRSGFFVWMRFLDANQSISLEDA
jgi:hypothetical protein